MKNIGCEEKQLVAAVPLQKLAQALVVCNIQLMPVVQSGAFELAVVNGKAHGLHQVQGRTGAGAGAGDVPRVLRNLRFDQNNVKWHI